MSGMCSGQNGHFQHGWNVLLSKSSVSARLERDVVQIIRFSMSGIGHGPNNKFQHDLECVMLKIVSFSMS
jgi:hypothetical protein